MAVVTLAPELALFSAEIRPTPDWNAAEFFLQQWRLALPHVYAQAGCCECHQLHQPLLFLLICL